MTVRVACLVIAGIIVTATFALAAVVTYSYDSAGRLIKADYGGARVVSYTYDNAGNLLSRVVQESPAATDSGESLSTGRDTRLLLQVAGAGATPLRLSFRYADSSAWPTGAARADHARAGLPTALLHLPTCRAGVEQVRVRYSGSPGPGVYDFVVERPAGTASADARLNCQYGTGSPDAR